MSAKINWRMRDDLRRFAGIQIAIGLGAGEEDDAARKSAFGSLEALDCALQWAEAYAQRLENTIAAAGFVMEDPIHWRSDNGESTSCGIDKPLTCGVSSRIEVEHVDCPACLEVAAVFSGSSAQ